MAKVRRAPEPSKPGAQGPCRAGDPGRPARRGDGLADLRRDGRPSTQRHQRQFREAVRQRFGDAAARSVPSGIQQIWIPRDRRRQPVRELPPGHHVARIRHGGRTAPHAPPGHPPRAPRRAVRLHAVPRRAGLGGRPRAGARARRRTGRSRCSTRRWRPRLVPGAGRGALMQCGATSATATSARRRACAHDQSRQAARGLRRAAARATGSTAAAASSGPISTGPATRTPRSTTTATWPGARARSAGTPRTSRIRAGSCPTR